MLTPPLAGADGGNVSRLDLRGRAARRPVALLVAVLLLAGVSFAGPGAVSAVFTDTAALGGNAFSTSGSFPLCYRDAVLADHPVGYWPLDETSGPTATDASGNGNDGRYTGGATPGQPGGLPDAVNDRSVALDGSGEVAVDPSTSLDVGQSSNQITLEAWIYRPTAPEQHAIFDYSDSSHLGVHLWSFPAGNELFANFIDTDGNSHMLQSGPVFTRANTWYHVAGTYDGDAIVLYVNGTEVARQSFGWFELDTRYQLNLGYRPDGNWGGLTGRIDEAAVYGTALPASRIRAHYNGGRCYKDEVLADSPSGYWRLGEPSGSTASEGVQGHLGSYRGGPDLGLPGAVPGADTSVGLDGADDYVDVPYSSGLNPAGTITVEAWAKLSSSGTSGTWRTVVSTWRAGDYGVGIWASPAENWQLWVGNGAGGSAIATAPLQYDRWTHLVGTYDGHDLRFYVDGLLADTVAGVTYAPNRLVPFGIGAGEYYGNGAWQQYFPGDVDEVAVYPTALSAARIRAHYLAGRSYADTVLDSKPVSYWRLGETSGDDTAVDSAGSDDGQYTNGPAREQPGAIAGDGDTSVGFDGHDEVVAPPSPKLTSTSQLSMELWVRRPDTSSNAPLLEFGDAGRYGVHLWCWDPDGDGTRLWANLMDTTGSGHGVNSDPVVTDNDRWYHVVMTYDRSVVRIYVDGAEVANGTVGAVDLDVNLPLNIGYRPYGGYGVQETIDDAAIYDRALTPEEVALHYDAGRE